VLLVPDSAQFDLFARSRGEARYYLAGPIDEPIWQSALPVIIGGPALSRVLISHIPDALGRLARSGSFAPIPLNQSVSTELHTTTEVVNATNVIGVIPGRDPRLSREYVVFTAHYDHLGISTPDARGDSIYNGFSDNAAGVAMLLAIAQQLKRQPPARSVAFVFFTAEERGLLGSTYFASQPAFPLENTVAVINLDGGAPPAAPIEWRLAGGASNTIGETARTIATSRRWKLDLSEASPNSDYWAFHARRVPAVFLIPGAQWEGVSATQRDALRARWDRYHRADDEWHNDFPFRGLQRYAQFALAIGQALAETPQLPRMR
jgi:Zn-dependent M28 family amino/carboxypeptidase